RISARLLRFLAMSTRPQRPVTVVGAGYVGLVTAVGLARLGQNVQIVETGHVRLEALRAGRIPIHEAGLQEAFDATVADGRLTVSAAMPDEPGIILVCVGTPIGDDGTSDLRQLDAAMTALRERIGIGADPRIGRTYMQPSFGFGGSCLPKELTTLAVAGRAFGLPMHVTTAASAANLAAQDRFAERVLAAVGGPTGRTIGLLGLAFKAGTDDIRDSPSVHLAARLLREGARVRAYDPAAGPNAL